MAIDFYLLSDTSRRERLFSLSHQEFDLINDVWEQLRKITGIDINAYGRTRLYPNHVVLLKKLLLQPSVNQSILNKLLAELSKVDEGFLIEGD